MGEDVVVQAQVGDELAVRVNTPVAQERSLVEQQRRGKVAQSRVERGLVQCHDEQIGTAFKN